MDKTLVETEESPGAVIRVCYVNKVFLKISENSQENTCALDSFLPQTSATLLKSDSMFSRGFCKVLKNTYSKTAASESVRHQLQILLSECRLEEEKERITEDNP